MLWQTLVDVNAPFVVVFGYPLSGLELIATIFGIWSVWLAGRAKVSNYPIGILNVIGFMIIFAQIRLYSDFLEQIYYLVASVYGWAVWSKSRKTARQEVIPSYLSWRQRGCCLLFVMGGTFALGLFVSHADRWFAIPQADYPWLDAFTTIVSFAAMFLMAKKKIESWWLWILVDIIAVPLYWMKEVRFISAEYALFLINAWFAWRNWIKIRQKEGGGDSSRNSLMAPDFLNQRRRGGK